jgi:hypothetical protein
MASRLPADLVTLVCSHCNKRVQLGPLLAQLTTLKVSRDGTALVKVESATGRGRQFTAAPNFDLCLVDFHNYLRVLNEALPSGNQFKTKKIKKRGRKKWVSRHDLILEGAILLWGDDVPKIMRLLPEFNENVIRRKLGHVLWKNYAISDLPKPARMIDEPDDNYDATPPSDHSLYRPRYTQMNDSQVQAWNTKMEPEFDETPEPPSALSVDKDASPNHNTRGNTLMESDQKQPNTFDRRMAFRDHMSNYSHDWIQLELDPVLPSISRFNSGEAGNLACSISDLSRLLSEGPRVPRDLAGPNESRKDTGFYKNSLVDIYAVDKQTE